MSSSAADVLTGLLSTTQDREMDCDAFAEWVAAYVDGAELAPEVVALLEHHRLICPECEEHLQHLVMALQLAIPSPKIGC